MIDLLELQEKTYYNTIRLGYDINKQATIDKIIDELEEFKKAKPPLNVFAVNNIAIIKDNKEFCLAYEKHLKDREGCEISDLINVLLSYCEESGQDSEMNLILKNRYNNHRSPKIN